MSLSQDRGIKLNSIQLIVQNSRMQFEFKDNVVLDLHFETLCVAYFRLRNYQFLKVRFWTKAHVHTILTESGFPKM